MKLYFILSSVLFLLLFVLVSVATLISMECEGTTASLGMNSCDADGDEDDDDDGGPVISFFLSQCRFLSFHLPSSSFSSLSSQRDES